MMKRFLLFFGLISLVMFSAWTLPDAQAQGVVTDLLGRINQLRAEQGLPAYRLNNTLNAAAQNQAAWMANTGQVSHTQTNGSSVRDRATAAGYGSSWVSENIYMGMRATVNSAWRFWLNSPIHYRGLVSPNYQDIGIASATGEWGQSFVLVFGNPGGRAVSVPRGNNSSNSNAAAESSGPPPPPPYFKGTDEQGYILHEIQPGDTLGDIALIYGYTWDDIPQILESNNLSPDDQRNLAVGEILRVPPQAGTYTPTPSDSINPEATPQATPQATETTANAESDAPEQPASVNTNEILPTPTPGSDAPSMPATATPQNGLVQPETYTQPTDTPAPTITPARLPVTQAAMRVATLPSAADTTDSDTQTVSSQPTTNDTPNTTETMQAATVPAQTPPLWLILAVGIQVLVLAVASVEYVRRH